MPHPGQRASTQRTPVQHLATETARVSVARVGVIAALLVLAVVVARIRAQGGQARLASPGDLPPDVVGAIGLAVLTTVLVLAIVGLRPRGSPGATRQRPVLTAEQRRLAVLAGLVGVLSALAYLLLTRAMTPARQPRSPLADQPTSGSSGSGLGGPQPMPSPVAKGYPMIVVVLAVLIVLVALLVMATTWRVGERASDHGPVDPTPDPRAEQRPAMARAVAAGRAAVRDDPALDPRRAIIACFAAMERALTRHGERVAPHAEDTPAEVLHRAVAAGVLAERPAGTLLRLFREARFSEHPLGEPDRADADRALSAMLAELRSAERSS